MAKKKQSKTQAKDQSALYAVLAAGGLGLLVGLFALGKRGKLGDAGVAGALDRALGLPSEAAGDGGSSAADLAPDQPHHGPADRASEDFRPDATAAIDKDRRGAFAPATLPNPNAAEPAM